MRKAFLFVLTLIILLVFSSCSFGLSGETDFVATSPTCTISIDCASVFDNKDLLDPAVAEFIPEGGTILPITTVPFSEGESIADLLRRVCSENDIPLETGGGSGTLYVEGIGHLYEFDCGDGSGWMYRVNGEYPNVGCDAFFPDQGDVIEWKYTCDFGEDIGKPIPD